MAGRPVLKRNSKTFARDIATLTRLRTSLQRNESGALSQEAIEHLNGLIRNLLLLKSDSERQAA